MSHDISTSPSHRVLVVDDLEEMRQIFACLVESAGGGAPSWASSASEALALVEETQKAGRPFTLILLDIKMPGINGIDAAKALRAAGFMGLLVACTASVSGQGRSECQHAGIDVYLDKRVVKKETIQALLERSNSRGNVQEIDKT